MEYTSINACEAQRTALYDLLPGSIFVDPQTNIRFKLLQHSLDETVLAEAQETTYISLVGNGWTDDRPLHTGDRMRFYSGFEVESDSVQHPLLSSSEKHFTFVKTPDASEELRSSFSELPKDPYCEHRFRRFSQYRVGFADDAWTLTRLPHRPLVRSKRSNSYVGGVLRHLEPLLIDATPFVQLVAAAIPLETSIDWQVDFHQWRTVCKPSAQSCSVPESPHQDGHQFGAILVVDRVNIDGGTTALNSLSESKPFYEIRVQPNSGIVFDDRRLLHYTSPIRCIGDSPAYRDIFVLDFNTWDERRYGPKFEQQAMVD